MKLLFCFVVSVFFVFSGKCQQHSEKEQRNEIFNFNSLDEDSEAKENIIRTPKNNNLLLKKSTSTSTENEDKKILKILERLQILYFELLKSVRPSTEISVLLPSISAECANGLKEFQKGLKEMKLWAVMMIDSWGKLPNGILEGTFHSAGDFDMCINTNVSGKFEGKYCSVTVGIKIDSPTSYDPLMPINTSYIFHVDEDKILGVNTEFFNHEIQHILTSICLPSSCSTDEIKFLVSKATEFTTIADVLNITVKDCIAKVNFGYTFNQKLGMSIILFIAALELLATIIDFRMFNSNCEVGEKSDENPLQKITSCLSIYKNALSLFKKEEHPSSVKIFNGLRVLTTIWIILFHIFLFHYVTYAQKIYKRRLGGYAMSQILFSATVSVDTFFFISGFLLSFTQLKSKCPENNFLYYVLRRYIRLKIPVFFLIGAISFIPNGDNGPFWNEDLDGGYIAPCSTGWWRNALCINNFSTMLDNCLIWTWHLGAEMQLYTAAYFLLLLFRKNPIKAEIVVKSIIFMNICFLAGYYFYNSLPPLPLLMYLSHSAVMHYFPIMHFKTYLHVAPYCVGILTGYTALSIKKIKISKLTHFYGALISTAIFFTVVFSSYAWINGRVATTVESVLYGCLHRFLWSLMLAWITLNYLSGEKSLVTFVLSWDGFTVLSRLSFMTYLIHSVFILNMVRNLRVQMDCGNFLYILLIIGYSFISYVAAIFFYLTCEAPLTELSNLLLKPGSILRNHKKKK